MSGKDIHKLLKQNKIETYTINRGHTYHDINLVSNLKELVQTCDIIISSVPKINETNNLFNEEIFKMMNGKFIVNVGRSNVICQQALYECLLNGTIGGAAIDTWEEKPKDKNTKLMPSNYAFHYIFSLSYQIP